MITMIRKRLGHIRDVNITRQRYNLAHDFPWNCVSTMSFMKWLIGLRYERNKMYASSIFYTLHFWEADSTNVIICKTKCKTMIDLFVQFSFAYFVNIITLINKRSKIVPIDINGISFFINSPSSCFKYVTVRGGKLIFVLLFSNVIYHCSLREKFVCRNLAA